jgi:hypothetical protein
LMVDKSEVDVKDYIDRNDPEFDPSLYSKPEIEEMQLRAGVARITPSMIKKIDKKKTIRIPIYDDGVYNYGTIEYDKIQNKGNHPEVTSQKFQN